MNSLFSALKKDKVLLTMFIFFIVVCLFDFSIIIFDIVSIIVSSNNAAKLTPAFLYLNIVTWVVSLAYIIFVVIYLITRKK